jgi:Zn-dependent peptidase ImmA (M78 family)
VGYRWGFKTQAESIAKEVRAELGLQALHRLDPRILAAHLDVPIVSLSDLETSAPQGVRHFLEIEPELFSAVTVFRGYHRTIVHNDGHSDGRQSSNIAHEISHGLLMHPPTPALDDRGCRHWDQGIEDEAQYLAGALLLPNDACLAMVFRHASIAEVAAEFGISEKMASYRMNVSGAYRIASRARQRHRS